MIFSRPCLWYSFRLSPLKYLVVFLKKVCSVHLHFRGHVGFCRSQSDPPHSYSFHSKKASYIHFFLAVYQERYSFIHSISIAPLQVLYYSEALPKQHRYCVIVSRRGTSNCA